MRRARCVGEELPHLVIAVLYVQPAAGPTLPCPTSVLMDFVSDGCVDGPSVVGRGPDVIDGLVNDIEHVVPVLVGDYQRLMRQVIALVVNGGPAQTANFHRLACDRLTRFLNWFTA